MTEAFHRCTGRKYPLFLVCRERRVMVLTLVGRPLQNPQLRTLLRCTPLPMRGRLKPSPRVLGQYGLSIVPPLDSGGAICTTKPSSFAMGRVPISSFATVTCS